VAADVLVLKREMEDLLTSEPLVEIDYVAIVDPQSLTTMNRMKIPVAICLAVKIGSTRLIDNAVIHENCVHIA
jgi:pantoate--beta-alanine ligase